jgi:hypothetical protein
MKLIPFDKQDPLALQALLELYNSWSNPEACPKQDELPETGYIIPGLAACFLYETDSNWCFLEHAIVGHRVPGHTEAITEIVKALVADAKSLGYVKVYCQPMNEFAILRAEACGFVKKSLPYRCQLEMEL